MSFKNDLSVAFGTVDAMISDVFEKIPHAFEDGDIVITYRDSTPVLEAISLEFLEAHEIEYESGIAALRIKENSAMQFMKLEIFEGFDEVFIVKADSSLIPYSAAAVLLPTYELHKIIPDEYVALFQEAGALRFFADGAGLNYAAEPQLVELLNRTFPNPPERVGRLF